MLVLTSGLGHFWKRGNIRKWCVKIEDWGFSVHFVVGFHPFTLYTYVLAKILQNGAKFIQKLTPGFKRSHEEFGQRQTSIGKSKKLKFGGQLLSKKYIHSPKTLYTEDLSNITFNYLSGNSPNYSCHLWNHKSFVTPNLLCIFLAQTLYTFYKGSPSECKFSDFPLLALKVT